MEPGRPDEELMLAYGAGDAPAFDALYARHKGAVLRYLRRQTGNAALAEELFQDVWLKLIDARAGYEPRAKFTTWLFTIAHNRLMDHFRSSARAALIAGNGSAESATSNTAAELGEPAGPRASPIASSSASPPSAIARLRS